MQHPQDQLKVIDASPSAGKRLEKDHVGRHDVADVILETRQPVAFDLTADCEATGRFVIVDGYDVAGGGIITAAVADELEDLRAEARLRDFNWVRGRRHRRATAPQRHGHRAALIMFVGKAGTGKHRYARARREGAVRRRPQRLHARRHRTCCSGVDHDLWVDAAQSRAGAPLRRGRASAAQRRASSSCRTTNAIGLADAAAGPGADP